MPTSWEWNHNTYYHRWLLRQLPRHAGTALDVGCGTGLWATTLAGRGWRVDAVDPSADMLSRARQRCREVRWRTGDVLDLPVRPDGYDVITAVSSLHHMPLLPALTRLAELVHPGGQLLVVGHYRAATLSDYAVDAVAIAANLAAGAARRVVGRTGTPDDVGMPVRRPEDDLAAVRRAVADVLPGARVRRALFWRFLLSWRRPERR